ncbi:MAG: hypothetical protein AAF950_02680 [Pseudomonadota bacterium]
MVSVLPSAYSSSGFAFGLCVMVAACGEPAASKFDSAPLEEDAIKDIAPSDFAIAPCDGVAADAFCAILAAGGKRVLIGAPSGVADGRIKGDAILPDAVLLPSLHPSAIGGLDELRYETWRAGRNGLLPVVGGIGAGDLVDGMNAAYRVPDAMAFLAEGQDRQGFDTIPLTAKTISAGDLAFDTGDLTIEARRVGPDLFGFSVKYDDQIVLILPCDAALPTSIDGDTIIIACDDVVGTLIPDILWPADAIVFISRDDAE